MSSSIFIRKHEEPANEESHSQEEESSLPPPPPLPTHRLVFDPEFLHQETKHLEVLVWTLFAEDVISLREMEFIKRPVDDEGKCLELYRVLEKKLTESLSSNESLDLMSKIYEVFHKTDNEELNKAIRVFDLKQ